MSQAEVVVVGSVNADLVVSVRRLPGAGETVTGGTFARHGGGKGANQAVAAVRAGARVAMVGAVGADDLGDEAVRELAGEGVDVAAVARLDGVATGVAAIVVDERGENQIAVASGANRELGADAVEAVLRGADGGVALLGFEVPDAPVLAGARAARAAGLEVVVNPAPARALPFALLALSPLLTPNLDEARALAGQDEAEAAARALAARTGAPVVVTLGADGALVLDGETLERIPAPRVEVVDPTGAGDAFNGALACELADGAALLDAVRSAIAVAARSTCAPGARKVIPRRAAG
jgi:ribokinase